MMVQQQATNRQAPHLPRRERRKIELEKYRLEKRIRKYNLPVTFDNDTTTRFANFGPVEAFKQAIGFQDLISAVFTMRKAPNSKYQSPEMLDFLVDAQVLGLSRFEHINGLCHDPGYLKIKGDLEDFPDETGFRRLFKAMVPESLEQLHSINQKLIAMRSQTNVPIEVWLDCDDSVITLHGSQEGGEAGYNPRYHGRPSIKAKIAFIAETAEAINLKAYGGKTHSNGKFLNFFKETDGFAVEEASQHTFIRNGAYMLIKIIAYNLMLWYKSVTMPAEIKNCRANTIRRKVLCAPGNVVGNGRYRHIRLAANKWLERVINQVKTNLDSFLWIVVQKLYPLPS